MWAGGFSLDSNSQSFNRTYAQLWGDADEEARASDMHETALIDGSLADWVAVEAEVTAAAQAAQ